MLEIFGGPDRDRTDDLFHAMEARSQLRHRPTLREDNLYSQGCGPWSQTLHELHFAAVASRPHLQAETGPQQSFRV